MSFKEIPIQGSLQNFPVPTQHTEQQPQVSPQKPNRALYPSYFVQAKVEFLENGDPKIVNVSVPSATVVITTINESGGFDTETVISPEGS